MTVRSILVSCSTNKCNNNTIVIFNIYFPLHQFVLKRNQILRYTFTVRLEFTAWCVGSKICRLRSLFHGDFNGCVCVCVSNFMCVILCLFVCFHIVYLNIFLSLCVCVCTFVCQIVCVQLFVLNCLHLSVFV